MIGGSGEYSDGVSKSDECTILNLYLTAVSIL